MTDELHGSSHETPSQAAGAELLARVREWIAGDPDPECRAELEALVRPAEAGDEDARAELADRFSGPLRFGTAGLRGRIGAGEHRMNRAVVIRAAAGLARYLLDRGLEGGAPRVVVGFDARHGSARFAEDSAGVFAAAGLDALLMPRALPTPLLAFAVRALGADAGVMVTASHNPPADNGYKVYLGGRAVTGPGQGAQIVPPADAEIAARIAAVPPAATVPRAGTGWEVLGEEIVERYLATALGVLRPEELPARALRIVLTPMHGVGGAVAAEALRRAGFADVYTVPEQAEPDPDFPTVSFPNPEEPGALDLALSAAAARGADIVIANDPDADRAAVAVPEFAGDDRRPAGWRVLRGDEVGVLLGWHLATRPGARGVAGADARHAMANSIVSSRLLARIAEATGHPHAETLTGFKWIARTPGLAYGFEEALGYCVDPEHVRDKDGITAGLVVAELAAALEARGSSLPELLDELARRFGLHATDQLAHRVADLTLISDAMARLRATPPDALGGSPVVRADDLRHPEPGTLPATDGLRYYTADDTRVVVRPSGTEPKLKCYLEVIVPVTGDGEGRDAVAEARVAATARLQQVRADLDAALGL